MKKIILSVVAVATLFATSCQNEAEVATNGSESVVTFVVETPEIGTRVFGDGTSATDLYYGIYDVDGNLISAISKVDEAAKESINISATVNLNLVTGNTYSLIFWADNADDVCEVDFAAKTMTYSPVAANAEAYDAFWAYVEPFVVTGNLTKTVYLYRPFAQLNIGTDDIAAATAAGMTVSVSKISLTTPTTLNLVDGAVSNDVALVYDYTAIPTGETFPVAGYEYLAMNYLLIGADKATVDVKFEYGDGTNEYAQDYTFVPVQRNYRTNIIGSLLTSAVNVNIIIDPIFEEPDYNVYGAFQVGGAATLAEDLVIDEPLVVKAGVNAVLNLNGKSITNKVDNTATDAIIVEAGATLTINGEGTIEAVTGNDGYAVIADGVVIINGGTFKAGVDSAGEANAVVYVRGNGEAYINGGVFPNENNSAFVLNKKDADRATTKIEVRGGEFTAFNPANNAAEGAGTNFVAEGYKVEQSGDVYTVVAQ